MMMRISSFFFWLGGLGWPAVFTFLWEEVEDGGSSSPSLIDALA